MFSRRSRKKRTQDAQTAAPSKAIGIGSLVVVRSAPDGRDEWEGEPSGVVIGPGDNDIAAYPGLTVGRSASWLVAFDELAYMKDGRGPFEQATVAGGRLTPVPLSQELETPANEGPTAEPPAAD